MTERQYHTCHEKGMDNILSMSRAQQLSSSPWFYAVYCKACGHVDGVFAQDVFTITRVLCFGRGEAHLISP